LEIEEGQLRAAVQAARESLRVVNEQYRSGTASYLDVVTAQVIALANERAQVQVAGRRFTSTVQLILALGGGWNASQLPAPSSLRKVP
jgi:outer membrane protein TolC